MAEDKMINAAETNFIPEGAQNFKASEAENNVPKTLPEIKIENSMSFSGQEIEKMRQTPVQSGGSQLDHLGEKSRYPQDKPSTDIKYVNQSSFTEDELVRMISTPVPGGGSQLEHLGDHSVLPPKNNTGFRERVAAFLRISHASGRDLDGDRKKAINMIRRFEQAGQEGRRDIQSRITHHLEDQTRRITDPIPVRVNGKNGR